MNKLLMDLIHYSMVPNAIRFLSKQRGSFVLLFHGIHKNKYDINPRIQKPDLTVAEFDNALKYLSRKFHFLSLDDFLNNKRGGVLLTFDDGFMNLLNILPILEKHNAHALIFVSSQIIKDKNNWLWFSKERAKLEWNNSDDIPLDIKSDLFDGLGEDKLQYLSSHPLIEIGCHTESHPYLTKTEPDILNREIVESKYYLEKIIKKKIRAFSYPLDDYNESIYKIVRNNFEVAFAGSGKPGFELRYEIPRIYIHNSKSSYLNLKTCGIYSKSIDLLKWK